MVESRTAQFEYWYLLVNMVLQVWSNIMSFIRTGRYSTVYSVFIMLNWYGWNVRDWCMRCVLVAFKRFLFVLCVRVWIFSIGRYRGWTLLILISLDMLPLLHIWFKRVALCCCLANILQDFIANGYYNQYVYSQDRICFTPTHNGQCASVTLYQINYSTEWTLFIFLVKYLGRSFVWPQRLNIITSPIEYSVAPAATVMPLADEDADEGVAKVIVPVAPLSL